MHVLYKIHKLTDLAFAVEIKSIFYIPNIQAPLEAFVLLGKKKIKGFPKSADYRE